MMQQIITELARLAIFVLPAYLANAAPVLLGGLYPIDGGMLAPDGRPWLGRSKTWLGILGGMAAGMLSALLLAHLLRSSDLDLFGSQGAWYAAWGFALSAGALIGDLAGSLLKRRLGYGAGKPTFLFDQLTFIVFALGAGFPLGLSFPYQPYAIALVLVATYAAHRGANLFAHAWGLKRVPW
jgi:CDP-2,3-bis-(O-geranylgeranyl)-sn-glycerol synthase